MQRNEKLVLIGYLLETIFVFSCATRQMPFVCNVMSTIHLPDDVNEYEKSTKRTAIPVHRWMYLFSSQSIQPVNVINQLAAWIFSLTFPWQHGRVTRDPTSNTDGLRESETCLPLRCPRNRPAGEPQTCEQAAFDVKRSRGIDQRPRGEHWLEIARRKTQINGREFASYKRPRAGSALTRPVL